MKDAGTSAEMSAAREPVLVCFAVRDEAAGFRAFAGSRPWIEVLVTGMGRSNTERALARRRIAQPSLVFTCGFAGGLNPLLETGDVVFETDDRPAERALLRAGARPARFHCAETVAVSAQDKARLRESSGADAVEMESGFVHSAFGQTGGRVVTVRAILDPAAEDLQLDFNEFMSSDQKLKAGKLALALLGSPGKIRGLLKLRRQSKEASRALALVLERVMEDLSGSGTPPQAATA